MSWLLALRHRGAAQRLGLQGLAQQLAGAPLAPLALPLLFAAQREAIGADGPAGGTESRQAGQHGGLLGATGHGYMGYSGL